MTAGSPGAGPPRSAGESHRLEHLRRFVDDIAERLPTADRVRILGPRTVAERVVGRLRELTHHRTASPEIDFRASRRLTEPQLVARVRLLAGDAPRRRTSAFRGRGTDVSATLVRPRRRPLPRARDERVDIYDELTEELPEPDEVRLAD